MSLAPKTIANYCSPLINSSKVNVSCTRTHQDTVVQLMLQGVNVDKIYCNVHVCYPLTSDLLFTL